MWQWFGGEWETWFKFRRKLGESVVGRWVLSLPSICLGRGGLALLEPVLGMVCHWWGSILCRMLVHGASKMQGVWEVGGA